MSEHAPAANDREPDPAGQMAAPSRAIRGGSAAEGILALQRTHGNAAVQRMMIQRAPPEQPAPAVAPAPGPAVTAPPGPSGPVPVPVPNSPGVTVPAAQGQPVVHVPSQVLLSESRDQVRFNLEGYFAQKGLDLLESFNTADDQFKLGYTGSGLDPTTKEPEPGSDDAAYRQRVIAIVRDELSTLRMQVSVFREYFQQRANDTLNTMLDESKAQVEKDKERYGAKVEGWVFKDYSLNQNADTADLAEYAKRLHAKHQAYLEVAASIAPAPRAELPGGGAPTGPDEDAYKKRQEAIDAAHARLAPLEEEYQSLRHEAEGKHPILVSYGLDIHGNETARTLAALASDSGDTRAALVVKQIGEKLDNIETVRKKSVDDRTRVWKLERVVGPTKNLPDVQTRLPLSPGMRDTIVSDKVLTVQLDEEFTSMAIGLVTLALALIAAVPTGGGSLAVAATATSTAVDLGLLAKAVDTYQFDSAASGSNYDKAKAISANEPDLFDLAFQIVVTAVGGAVVIGEARAAIGRIATLRDQALGLKAASMSAEGELAGKLKPQFEKALGDLEAAGEQASPGAGKKLKQQVLDDPDPARVRRTAGGPAAPPGGTPAMPSAPNAIMLGPSGRPMTRVDAFSEYFRQIEANPMREYAVIKDTDTNTFAVIIGEEQQVRIPVQLANGEWGFETHYHPNFPWLDTPEMKIVESNFIARIPSPDDVMGTMTRSTMSGRTPVMERVDWRDPSRNTTTTYQSIYGYTPTAGAPGTGKFWVQYPNQAGGMSPRRQFDSLAEYRRWFDSLEAAGPKAGRPPKAP
jgi:hypothetical protein